MSRKRESRAKESIEDIFLSQDLPGPSSQTSVTLQRRTRSSSILDSQRQNSQRLNQCSSQRLSQRSSQRSNQSLSQSSSQQLMNSQSMEIEKNNQLVSNIIRYLFAMDRTKQPIPKGQIIKNVLGGNSRIFRPIIENVKKQLSQIFGYNLVEIENNKYILVNEIDNSIPHLTFYDSNKQVLLFLVLVHIFMYGETCKEEILWDFLRNLGIITNDNFQHDYFGDVKQLITVEFVNQKYLEKRTIDNELSLFEYVWGSRAINEVTYRSALQFVANVYGCSMNKWKLQYKAVIEEEQGSESD